MKKVINFISMKTMLKILVIVLSNIAFNQVHSQVYSNPNPSLYGIRYNRIKADSALLIPTGCGAPVGTASLKSSVKNQSAKYFDSCAGKEYTYNPKDSTWRQTGSTSKTHWDSLTNKPANFSTTYALSNDIKDSVNSKVSISNIQTITGAKTYTSPVTINSGASISLLTSGNINVTSLGDAYFYLNNSTPTTGRNWQLGSLTNGDFTISNFTASTVPLTIKASGASIFSSSVSIGGTTAGRVNIINGNSSNTGFVEWIKSDGTTRQAYLGYDNSNLTLFVESGQFKINGVTNTSSRLNVAGATDNPSYEFNLNGNAKVGTIYANSVYVGDIVLDATQLYRNSSSPLYLNYLGTGQTLIGNSAGITLYGALSGTSASFSGNISALNLTSNTYTPSFTNLSSVTAFTNAGSQYMRVGNVVTVSGAFSITTSGSGTVEFQMSIPFTSSFSNAGDLSGSFTSSEYGNNVLGIALADYYSKALFRYDETATGSHSRTIYYHFTYLIR